MMNFPRIVKLHASEIIYDPSAAADAVAKACSRGEVPLAPSGCCDLGEGEILIPLAETNGTESEKYYFVPFPDSSEASAVAELHARYRNDTELIGSFRFEDSLWGFFRRIRR